jgi:hypothetical protein
MALSSTGRPILAALIMGLAALGLTSCGGFLPKRQTVTASTFSDYDQARLAYSRVIVGQTTVKDLKALGFDPATSPNVKELTYLEVMNTFMPHDGMPMTELPNSIQRCIAAQTECVGYAVTPGVRHDNRSGSLFLDFFNFKRTVHRTGWNVDTLFVVLDGTVVYKLMSGTPHINETRVTKNPLGPLQNAGALFNHAIPSVRY